MLRRFLRLPDFPLIILPFILLAPVWVTGSALFWGTPALQFVPWRYWAWEVIRSGHLPLWNPLVGMGAPLIANYQSSLFYPPNWLYFLLAAVGGISALAWGQALLVAAHLTFAALGMARLARQLGLNPLAQTVSGLAFGLSGYLVASAGFLSINAAVAWLPWVMCGVTQVAGETKLFPMENHPGGEKPLPSSNAFLPRSLTLCLAMQLLAGHAQITWYTWLLAGMWAIFLCLSCRIPRLGYALLRLTLAFVLAIALAAIQLVPTAEYLMQSQRAAAVDETLAMTYSFWPWRFLTLLLPHLFGNPALGDYWGYGNYWEDAVYIGVLPLLLALVRLFRRPAARSSPLSRATLPAFLLTVTLLSFLLALGNHTPIFPWLYRHLPTFKAFQAPTRFTLWAEFTLALLAGMGVQGWRRPHGRGLYWTRLGTAGAGAITIGAGLAWILMDEISSSFIRSTALFGLWGVGAGMLMLRAPAPVPSPSPEGEGEQARNSSSGEKKGDGQSAWQGMVVLLISADVLIAGWGLNPPVETDFYRSSASFAAQIRSMAGEGRLYLPVGDEEYLKFERFFGFDSFDLAEWDDWENVRAALLPNLPLTEGIASANNFDPLLPGRYARWMTAFAEAQPRQLWRMLNLMNVTVVERVDESQPLGVRFDLLSSLPLVRWVPCARFVHGAEASLAQALREDWNPEMEVTLEGETSSLLPVCLGVSSSARVITESPNRLSVRVQADADGYLVVADVWYPGWTATVDGQTTSVLRANYLFRAVSILAGEHEVTFVYRPLSFYLGATISLLAWLFVVIVSLVFTKEATKVHHRTPRASR